MAGRCETFSHVASRQSFTLQIEDATWPRPGEVYALLRRGLGLRRRIAYTRPDADHVTTIAIVVRDRHSLPRLGDLRSLPIFYFNHVPIATARQQQQRQLALFVLYSTPDATDELHIPPLCGVKASIVTSREETKTDQRLDYAHYASPHSFLPPITRLSRRSLRTLVWDDILRSLRAVGGRLQEILLVRIAAPYRPTPQLVH